MLLWHKRKLDELDLLLLWKNCLGHNTMHKRKNNNKRIVNTKLWKRMYSKNKLSDYLLWSRRVLHCQFYSWHSPGLRCSSANCVRDSGVQQCQYEDSLCQCRRRRNGLTHPRSHCVSDWSTGMMLWLPIGRYVVLECWYSSNAVLQVTGVLLDIIVLSKDHTAGQNKDVARYLDKDF